MGVGQSRVGPTIPENDDSSLKSTDEKSSQKKPGVVRFIIDAFLGESEKYSTPSSGGCGFPPFPESPESGTDFDMEEKFVDAPLPAARQRKEVKSERRVTPGRARTKRRNVTSKCGISQNVQVIEEQSRPSHHDGEVETVKPVEDASTIVDPTRPDVHSTSDGSNESLEVPWSHGRGDNTPSTLATTDSRADKLTYQTPDALKTRNGPSQFQSNSRKNIHLSDTHGTTALSTIQKMIQISSVGSDQVNGVKGGGEAQLEADKDTNTLAIKEETKLRSTASNKTISNIKSEHPVISASETQKASNVSPTTGNKKSYPVIKRAQGIPRRQAENLRMLNKNRLEMFTVEKRKDPSSLENASDVSTAVNKVLNGREQGKQKQKKASRKVPSSFPPFKAPVHRDLIHPSRVMMKTEQVGSLGEVVKRPDHPLADIHNHPMTTRSTNVSTPSCFNDSKADSMGREETPKTEKRAEFPGVYTTLQTQIPTIAELRDTVEDARKELDSIEMYLRTSLKRTKLANVDNNQGRAEVVKQNKSSASSSSKSRGVDIKSSSDQAEVLPAKPLLCPVFDNPISRSVVFRSKKVGTAATGEEKSAQCKESKDDVKQPSLTTVRETSTSESFVSKQKPAFARMVSRKVQRKKTSARPVKTPYGSDRRLQPPYSNLPVGPVPQFVNHCDNAAAVMILANIASACEDKQVNRRNFLYIQKQGRLSKPYEDPFQPNEIFAAYVDGNLHSLEMMLQRNITRNDLNNALYLLRRVLPHITQSMKKYFPIPSTSNVRGLCVTKMTDGDFDSMFQESLTWWERKRPGVLFNSKFYPRRFILPYFDKVGNDIELTAESYHVHGVQYLPIIGYYQETEGAMDGIMMKEGEVNSAQERTTEKSEENNNGDVQVKSVVTSRDHSKTSLQYAKEQLTSVLAEVSKLVMAYLKSQSAIGQQVTPCNHKPGEVLHWYREMNKLSRRMNLIENDPASAGTSVSYKRDLILAEYYRLLKQFDAWKQQHLVGKESLQSTKSRDSKKVEKRMTTVVQQGAENANVQPNHDSEQRLDVAKAVPIESPQKFCPSLNQELVRQFRTDINGNEMATGITVRKGAKDMITIMTKEVEKNEDGPGNTVSDAHNGVTTAVAPEDDCGPDGEVTKPLAETGKDGTTQVKDESFSRAATKVEVNSQTASGKGDSTAGADEGHAKKKLGRGPRIIGDMRRIVHCQRRRRTETPTTQLKIKFCLGCGDTRQPNGEPLMQCATCDEAFFCCSKCQRDTRNEHREKCKGVKRNYCRHW